MRFTIVFILNYDIERMLCEQEIPNSLRYIMA